MRITKFNDSSWIRIKHKGYTCHLTLRKGAANDAVNVSFPTLAYSKISSERLTKNSAKIIGEIFLKISDLIE